jgi:hypothetical protein
MSPTPEEAYFRLGTLMAELPDLASGPITPEMRAWLRRAGALVQSTGGLADTIQFRVALENFDGILRPRHARTIVAVMQRVLAKAELEVPAESRGAFLSANNAFDVFAAVRRVLNTAQSDVLLVDTDADATALTDYAVLAPDAVAMRLLSSARQRASLGAAIRNWQQRFGVSRPLSVRLAADAATLPDRAILVDNETAWVVGASFSELARDKRTTLMRMPPDAAATKIVAYAEIWQAAEPLLHD